MRLTENQLREIYDKRSRAKSGEIGVNPKPALNNRHALALSRLAKNPHLRSGVVNGVKKGNASHEHWEQIIFFSWLLEVFPEYYSDFYAIPNGGLRPGFTGSQLKDEGVQSGQPDINGDLAKGIYFGLKIEMKWDTNKPSTEQISIMQRRTEKGFFCALCYSAEEAIEVVSEYLNLNDEQSMKWSKNASYWKAA